MNKNIEQTVRELTAHLKCPTSVDAYADAAMHADEAGCGPMSRHTAFKPTEIAEIELVESGSRVGYEPSKLVVYVAGSENGRVYCGFQSYNSRRENSAFISPEPPAGIALESIKAYKTLAKL